MRFVLIDEDRLITSMIEGMLQDLGHEVLGVVDTTAAAVQLIHATRPDVVILDLSLGYNTDFDAVGAAEDVGARTIVFSYNADDAVLSRYRVRPMVVFKPDLSELERVVGRLDVDAAVRVVDHDRRTRPSRPASGPPPTNLADAQAFYEAVNDAVGGDALISIDLPDAYGAGDDPGKAAARVQGVMRATDRLVASASSVRIFLPGGAQDGIQSLLARLDQVGGLPEGATVRSIVVAPEELPADAFDRLKQA